MPHNKRLSIRKTNEPSLDRHFVYILLQNFNHGDAEKAEVQGQIPQDSIATEGSGHGRPPYYSFR